MMRAMLAIVLRCLLLFVLAASSVASDLPLKFDPKRDAAKDVAAAVQLAKAQGKRVLVDVGGEWCAWCHIMDRFFSANEEARTLRDAHYVWVKVNWSRDNRNEAVLSQWPKISGYPHLFVLDADGKLLHSQDTSLLEEGKGYDLAKFVVFLRMWSR
jgi:thiol:disulfide interchange protein